MCQIRTTLKGEGENIQSCKRDHRKLLSRLQTIFGNFHLVHLIYSSTPSPSKPPDHRAKFLKDQALAPAEQLDGSDIKKITKIETFSSGLSGAGGGEGGRKVRGGGAGGKARRHAADF